MNYAFSFPLYIYHKKWSFSFSYTYTIPKALDGEPLLLTESSFLSGGITYVLNFKKKQRIFFRNKKPAVNFFIPLSYITFKP